MNDQSFEYYIEREQYSTEKFSWNQVGFMIQNGDFSRKWKLEKYLFKGLKEITLNNAKIERE